MPCIVTSIHDPRALTATCARYGLPAPAEGVVHLANLEASGWLVRLPGVRYPIVCDTLTGVVAYHPTDNAFGPYARIMRFVHRYYDIRARHQDDSDPSGGQYVFRPRRRCALAG